MFKFWEGESKKKSFIKACFDKIVSSGRKLAVNF